MSEIHTIAEVAADETLLRRLAGEVLDPGSWKHERDRYPGGDCLKCGVIIWPARIRPKDCPIPDPAIGSLPGIVSQLIKKCSGFKGALHTIINEYLCATGRHTWGHEQRWQWFSIDSTPAEQAACLLAVLLPEKVKVKHE